MNETQIEAVRALIHFAQMYADEVYSNEYVEDEEQEINNDIALAMITKEVEIVEDYLNQ